MNKAEAMAIFKLKGGIDMVTKPPEPNHGTPAEDSSNALPAP
jgi:hypothetical protein